MPRGFAARVVCYQAVRDLIPFYGVYTLLFRDSGLSASQISLLFVIWSLTGFVLEVPSGAWADVVDRRRLLIVSGLISGAGYACWVVFPTFAGFAAGFVLWSLSGALESGTFEAWLFESLEARGCEPQYARIVGWSRSAAIAAALASTLSSAPLFAWGGYDLVGWASVATGASGALFAYLLPPGPPRAIATDSADEIAEVVSASSQITRQYVSTLRNGLHEIARQPAVRHLVLVASAMLGLTVYDEFFPLVAKEHGVPSSVVPLAIAVTMVGQLVGTSLAGRTATMSGRAMGAVVAMSAVCVSVGALISPWLGFALLSLGFGLAHNAVIVSDAWLQAAMTGSARATVTSVAGFGTEIAALVGYVGFAAGSIVWSVSTLVAVAGVPMLAVAASCVRWLAQDAGRAGYLSGTPTRR